MSNEKCHAFDLPEENGAMVYPKVLLFNVKNFAEPHIDIYLEVRTPKGGSSFTEVEPYNEPCLQSY